MDIKRFFSGLTGRSDMNVLHTPYGSFNLAKEDNRKRVKHIVMSLQQTTDALTRTVSYTHLTLPTTPYV